MRFDFARVSVLIAVACAPAACLLDWDSLRPTDGGATEAGGDLGVADVSKPDVFSVPEASGVDANDADSADVAPCSLLLTINEVQVEGPQGASDEFVELRNGAPCGGSLQTWGLRYSSYSGSSPLQIWTGQPGDTIGPKGPTGYVILGGYAFQAPDGGALIGRISTDLNGILSTKGGGVGLFSPSGALIDGVAYETLATQTHPFIRPSNAGSDGGAPNPPSGKSIARTPDGQNSNTNATDFQIATPTPGSPN